MVQKQSGLKRLIFGCLLLGVAFTAPIAQAGDPATDLLADAFRESFRLAHAPELAELKVDRDWTCSVQIPLPAHGTASNAVEYDAFRLKWKGGHLVNEGRWSTAAKSDDNVFGLSKSNEVENISARTFLLVPGTVISDAIHWVVRAADSTLLMEMSTPNPTAKSHWPDAIAVKGHKAFTYLYCLLSRYQAGDRRAFNYTPLHDSLRPTKMEASK